MLSHGLACRGKKLPYRPTIYLSVAMLFTAFAQQAHAKAHTYFVSPTGADSAPGESLRTAFRTIQRAAGIMSPGDRCIIASGTYRESVTPLRSGLPGRPITFEAARGATVTISGMEPVRHWIHAGGEVYRTPLAWTLGPENQVLIVHGNTVTPMWEARWPKIAEESLPAMHVAMARAAGGSASSLVDPNIKQPANFCNGATIWCRGGTGGWLVQTSTVRSYNPDTHTLTFDKVADTDPAVVPGAGTEYYLSGSPSLLTQEREWVIDPEDHQLYLAVPGGGAPQDVEVKQRLTGLNLTGKSYVTVSGVRLLGCNIRMERANHCVVDGIRADYIYHSSRSQGYADRGQLENGLFITGDDNTIINSEIAHSTGTALNVLGNRNRIVNNDIHDTNMSGGYSAPLVMRGGYGTLVSHNTIRNTGRYCILWQAGSGTIAYNDLHDYDWLTKDSGALYCWGVDLQNTEIHHNTVRSGHAYENDAGIYLDNFTENAVVHHNVVSALEGVGIRFNTPGQYRLLYNNTVVDCTKSFDRWGESPYNDELFGTVMRNNVFTASVDHTPDLIADHNVESKAGLKFVDPAHQDYRLASGYAGAGKGVEIPGITAARSASMPDCGAFEAGLWRAGSDLSHPVKLAEIGVSKPVSANVPGLNLLVNGSFESQTDAWTASDKNAATTMPVPDTPSWQKRGKNNKLKLGGEITQKIRGLQPLLTYRLSGWFYTDHGETLEIKVSGDGIEDKSVTVSDTQFVQVTVRFKMPAGKREATVTIRKSSAGPGYAYADDIGLVAEP